MHPAPKLRLSTISTTLAGALALTLAGHSSVLADQVLLPIVPGESGESGTVHVLNPSRSPLNVTLSPVGDGPFIQGAVGGAGAFILGPGASIELPYVGPDLPSEEEGFSLGAVVVLGEESDVLSWVSATDGSGFSVARARSTLRATRNFILPGFENWADGSATGRVHVVNVPGAFEATVTVTALDAAGGEIGSVEVPMLFPFSAREVTGEQLGVDGEATIVITSDRQIAAGAVVGTTNGYSLLTSGRDVIEFGQFWYPFWGGASFTNSIVLSNTESASGSIGGQTLLWGRRATTPSTPQAFTVAPGDLVEQPLMTLSGGDAFQETGAVCVEVLSGSALRAPSARVERTGGDFEYSDPMRRIEPGNHGFAIVPGDDAALVAESVVVLHNPSSTTAIGELRLRDLHGRVLLKRRVAVRAKFTVAMPLKRLVGRRTTARSLELVNPVPNPNARRVVGGGDFQAAVILSTERVGNRRARGNGDSLATVPFLPTASEAGPSIVGATLLRADDDRRGQLRLDGRASGVGRRATLRMFDLSGTLVGEWRVRVGGIIRLPLRARATNRTTVLAQAWPLGEARDFVLRDDKTNGTSAVTRIVRQEGSEASPSVVVPPGPLAE